MKQKYLDKRKIVRLLSICLVILTLGMSMFVYQSYQDANNSVDPCANGKNGELCSQNFKLTGDFISESSVLGASDDMSGVFPAVISSPGGTVPAEYDLDNDGKMSIKDYVKFAALYISEDLKADYNNDTTVNIMDFMEFIKAYKAYASSK